MSRRGWTVAGIAGGLVGAAGAAAGAGVATQRRKIAAARRSLATEMAEHGGNPPAGWAGEESSVMTDDGVRIACEEVGPADGSAPGLTVVLVHGFALDRRTWQEQREFLAQLSGPSVRMVLYDQRSHDRSERAPQDSCTIDQLGRDLDAVIRALAPEGPLVLVAHSMGGMTVMALAEQHPELFHERVAGVALVSTSAGEMASAGLPGTFLSRRNPVIRTLGGLAAWQPNLVETGRRALGDIIWAVTKRFAYGDRQVDPRMVDLVDTMIDANAVGALTDFVDTLGTHDRVAALPGLSGAEVLVLAGDADRIIPYRHSEVIAEAIPTARLVRLHGVGHMPMLEQPDTVDGELGDLIERSMERTRGRRFRLTRPPHRSMRRPSSDGAGAGNGTDGGQAPTGRGAGPRRGLRAGRSGTRTRRGPDVTGPAAPVPGPGEPPLRRELPTVADTEELGAELGRGLAAGDLVLLTGPLGAGKTALVRGLARGLGVTGTVASPTFVIAREHPPSGDGPALVHVDAYRLGGPDGRVDVAAELDDLDLDTELERAVVAVEWGAGVADRLADSAVEVVLERRDDETRVATLRRTARP